MPIYMKIEGIDGAVTAKGHEKWHECDSFQFGITRAITMAVGRGANREASAPQVSEMMFTKRLDESTALLFQACSYGQTKKVEVDFVTTYKEKLDVYLQYKLTDAVITNYQISGAGDRPMESLSLNFTKIEMAYTGADAKMKQGSAMRASYDLSTAVGG